MNRREAAVAVIKLKAALNGLADNAAKALANAFDGPVLRGSPR